MMFSRLRRRLAWKLFLSYLIVIVVGVVVLATAAEFRQGIIANTTAARAVTSTGTRHLPSTIMPRSLPPVTSLNQNDVIGVAVKFCFGGNPLNRSPVPGQR